MKKKIFVLVLLTVLLLVAGGVVSATTDPGTDPGNVINMQLDTAITLTCQGGHMEAVVDNNKQPATTYVSCYSFLPPIQGE